VSVLLCVHDAEKTLRRAVESVQNQTLRNVELVAVDAGSEDSSVRMLDTFMERDIRVVVEHLPACSREEALDAAFERARGEYIVVMDADGWFDATYLQKLVDTAESEHVDLVVGGVTVQIETPRRRIDLETDETPVVYRTQHDFRTGSWEHFASGRLSPASAKLFDRARAAANKLRFNADNGNDHGFTFGYLRDVERVAFTGGGYHVSREVPEEHGVELARELYRDIGDEYEAVIELLRGWGLEGDAASMTMIQGRYLELLALCVEAACATQTGDTSADVRALVGQMIFDERAQLAAGVGLPRDGAARALIGPIKSQNVPLAIMQARLLSMVRRGAPATLAPDAFL